MKCHCTKINKHSQRQNRELWLASLLLSCFNTCSFFLVEGRWYDEVWCVARLDNVKKCILTEPWREDFKLFTWQQIYSMRNWQGQLLTCHLPCDCASAYTTKHGINQVLFSLFSSRWQQATMQPDWTGDGVFFLFLFLKHLYLCKRAEVHRCGVLFLFFPWVNNLLPYLSLILLSSGVYSGKPGWAGIVSAVYFDCVKLEWMWGLVGSGVWSAHYPFYSPDVYLLFILPGMPQQLEGVTCSGHSLSFLNWHLTTALNASI